MNGTTLTICFEDPFWIALVEVEDEAHYQVARHVFGPEPTQPEVEAFVLSDWRRLNFSPALAKDPNAPSAERRINPKRQQRLVKKELARSTVKSTKAQLALADQREAAVQERKAAAKKRKADAQERDFQLRTEKRKQKHRGH